jgi:hypothetical protein
MRWARQRQYQAVHISSVLKSAIPPATICGWLAALVTIGTPHRDTLVWQRGINWKRDFLTRNQVDYLFLASYFPEKEQMKPLFAEPLHDARLTALFKLYDSDFYLLELSKTTFPDNILEAETFTRESGQVIYDPHCGQKMALLITSWKFKDVQLQREFMLPVGGNFTFSIKGQGEAIVEVEVLDSSRRHQPQQVHFTGKNSEEKGVIFARLSKGPAKLLLTVEPLRGSFILDKVRLQRQINDRL